MTAVERKENINYDKRTQTAEESEENGIELNDQSTSYRNVVCFDLTIQKSNPTSRNPCFLNIPCTTKDVSKLSQINDPECEEFQEIEEYATKMVKNNICLQKNSETTISKIRILNNEIQQLLGKFQPSQKPEIPRNLQVSENVSGLNTAAEEEFFPDQVASSRQPSRKPEIRRNLQVSENVSDLNPAAEEEFFLDQVACSRLSSTESENVLNLAVEAVVEDFYPNQADLQDALTYIDDITNMVDNIEIMNNYLTKALNALLEKQQRHQSFLNFVNDTLTQLHYLSSTVILLIDENTLLQNRICVRIYGEEIFRKLKSIKKELNGLFRELSAFRKNFRNMSRKISSIPFELKADHEMHYTLDKSIEIYFVLYRLFNTKERFENIERKIDSDIALMTALVKKFGDYLQILRESFCNEILV